MTKTKFRPKAALAGAALLSILLLPALPALADPLPAPEFNYFSVSKGADDDMVVVSWREAQWSNGLGLHEIVRFNAQDPKEPPEIFEVEAGPDQFMTFKDTGAVPGVIYKYFVRTYNAEDTYGHTDELFGWAGEVAAPAEEPFVTNFVASQGAYPDRIRLTWNSANTRWVESYVITRGEWDGDVPFSTDLTIPCTGDNFFEDTGIVPGRTYEYRLRATDLWGRGMETEFVEGWASDEPIPVTDLAATQGTLADRVRLTWTAPTYASTYTVVRLRNQGGIVGVETLADGLASPGFDDTTAEPGVHYDYRVDVKDIWGRTAHSSLVTGWTPPGLSPVDDFTASRGEYPDRVWLYWTTTDASSIKSWRILRYDDASGIVGYDVLTNSTMVESGFLDTTATPDVRYRYELLFTDLWGRETLAGTAWGWAFRVPDNDNFKDARAISAKSGSSAATNNCASFEVSEPYPAGVPSATRTVWWSYTAPFDGVVRFDTLGSHDLSDYGEEDAAEADIPTALAIYTGDAVTKLDEVCRASGTGCGNAFEAAAGTVYRIQASGYGEYEGGKWWGKIRLNWSYTHLRVALDANGGTISTNAVMVPAGQKLGDALASFPVPEREGYRFVDWKFENNASVSASAAYALTESHTFTAEWAWISQNDDFEDALPLNAPGQVSGFSEMPNANATLQAGEPLLAAYPGATHTLWWSWTAAEDCTVRFSTTNSVDTQGSQIDTVLGVYTGNSLASLVQVATGDDGVDESGFIDDIGTFWSFVEFKAAKGTTYYICVGVNDKHNRQVVEGTIRLNWGLVKDGVSSGGYALLPPGSSGLDIPLALGESADPSLEDLLGGDVDAYNDFAEWANGMGAEDVRASSHAAASYLLGTTELLQNDPEISIERMDFGPDQDNGDTTGDGAKAVRPRAPDTPATLTLAVTVRDGGEAVEVTAAKVAALVEATRDACDWESPEAKLDPHAEAVTSGSGTIVTIVATPGDGTVPRAFLRVAP